MQRTVPFGSFTVAVAVVVPVTLIAMLAKATETVATCARTVTGAEP